MTDLVSHRRLWNWLWPSHAIAVALAGVFALILIGAFSFPSEARLFPLIIGTVGIILAVVLLIQPADTGEIRQGEETVAPPDIGSDGPRFTVALLSAPVYSLLVWVFGFYGSSFLALIILPYVLGYRRLLIIVFVAFLLVIVLYVVFSVAMDMSLPFGMLGDWALNKYVYDH